MAAQLFLHQLPLGPMQNFVYLVGTEGQRDVIVVDPAWDVDAIEKTCAVHCKRLSGILLTHSHKDHTNGVAELLRRRDLPIYAQRTEIDFSEDLQAFQDALRPLAPGDPVPLGGVVARVIHTPGHTPGSTCFLIGKHLFTGDTLFPGGPGNTQRDPVRFERIIASIRERLFSLPDNTIVYPGHGRDTTIGRERPHLEEWIARGW